MQTLLVGLVLILFSAVAMADVVELKDGSRIKGTVKSVNASTVELETPNGVFNINRSGVRTIRYDDADQEAAEKVRQALESNGNEQKPEEEEVEDEPVRIKALVQEEQIEDETENRSEKRSVRGFASLDFYGAADFGDKLQDNFNQNVAFFNATVGPTSGELSIDGGLGVRLGLVFSEPSGFEIGPSIGYISGPGGEGSVNSFVSGLGPAHVDIEIESKFTRMLVEARRTVAISERAHFRIGAGAGYARGEIEETDNYSGSLIGTVSVDDSWGGFTWEVSPAFVFDMTAVSIEFGVRYSGFPKKKESDEFSALEWNPFGFYTGILF
jgi:opacity protein-like surface antigen